MKWIWRKIKSIFKKKPSYDETRMPSDDYTPVQNDPASYKLWIPFAENIHKTMGIKMRTRGEYHDGYPEGLVVHWTAGWQLKKGFWPIRDPSKKLIKMARDYAKFAGNYAVESGYNFLIMDVFGNIYQSRTLDKWGYHAGKSYWRGLGYSVSKKLAGVELLNPGQLQKKNGKFYAWYGLEIPKEYVRWVGSEDGYGVVGYFCTYTPEQEESLLRLCNFLEDNSPHKENGSPVFKREYILGHHEVSKGRKSDPGGSLSIPMDEFRKSV